MKKRSLSKQGLLRQVPAHRVQMAGREGQGGGRADLRGAELAGNNSGNFVAARSRRRMITASQSKEGTEVQR